MASPLATCVKSIEHTPPSFCSGAADHFAELRHVKITQGYLAFDERGVEGEKCFPHDFPQHTI
jgi:hypothetical protein